MFSFKKPPIQIFVRHCHYSAVSAHKARLPNFTHHACLKNLLATLPRSEAKITCFLDTFHAAQEPHFLSQHPNLPVVEIKAGSEAVSFLFMLEHVLKQKLAPETIIYFLEDDYLHRPGWSRALKEAFTLPGIDYVTLYDHKDKYFAPEYAALSSKIFHTASCHWRTTPSTTNTYAMRFETLKRDAEVHRQFSLGRTISCDHDKFCRLKEMGAVLISAVPGFSTHAEPEFASPCVDWHEFICHKS